jgi:proteic killer suppression protein
MRFDAGKIALYTCPGSGVPAVMIESFKHKGLKRLFEDDDRRGVNPQHVRKLRQLLALLQAAENIADLDYPTLRLHPLKGDLQGFWSITLRANWRIIFRFENGKAFDLDLVDYH